MGGLDGEGSGEEGVRGSCGVVEGEGAQAIGVGEDGVDFSGCGGEVNTSVRCDVGVGGGSCLF